MTIEQQNNIIQTLKEVDGETVQYILKKIGMDYQMLRQLIMTMPLEIVNAEMSERFDLESSLRRGQAYKILKHIFNHKKR